jgi:hypothetical protein
MSRRNVQGTIYLIHFSAPYKHAAHYSTGPKTWNPGSPITRRGAAPGSWPSSRPQESTGKLARTWQGDRYRERQLKNQGSSKRHCPECGVHPRKDTNMQTALTQKATPQEAAELQDTLERGYKRAYQAAREADPWGSDYEARFQTAAECNEVAADVVHETLENGMRRPAESTADFLSRTKAQAQTAEAKRAGFQTADQLIRAQADAGMTPEAISRHQEEITASLLSDAQTADGQAFAREYADTAGTYLRDLKELDEPGLTPGAPHPDPALAAKGWHVCKHGIYTRRPDAEHEAEPEAC